MTGPAWLAYVFAGVMILTSVYCVARLAVAWRQRRPTDHDVDSMHIVMGVVMAGMLVPRLQLLWPGGWAPLFGGAAAWFGWHAVRGLRSQDAARRAHAHHHVQHLLACVAMLYMLAVKSAPGTAGRTVAAAGGMSGSAARFPTLALVLAVALLGYAVWATDRLASLAPVAAGPALLPVLARIGTLAPAGPFRQEAPGRSASPAGRPPQVTAAAGRSERRPVSLRLAACCEIAMGVTMGYMLVMML
jgi:hypothetical protein